MSKAKSTPNLWSRPSPQKLVQLDSTREARSAHSLALIRIGMAIMPRGEIGIRG